MKAFRMVPYLSAIIGVSVSIFSPIVNAAAFQLWEQDGASMGNFHAGYAAGQDDASTAFYNPAGLTRLDKSQWVFAGIGILPSAKYKGTVSVDTISNGAPMEVTAQGGNFVFVPAMHYVSPLSDRFSFGFSVAVPFGLKTDYGKDTVLRYAATTTSITTIDVSPSIGFKATDKLSFGAGPDYQYATAEFDQTGTLGGRELDSDGINKATGSGYGYHAGLIYQLTSKTRFGLSYHSQVVHHLTGTSVFSGPIANFFGGPFESKRTKVDVRLPAYTAASLSQAVTPKLTMMGSVIFTQWNVVRELILQNVAGLEGAQPSTNIVATIPQYFHNTWNVSVGGKYRYNDRVALRAGVGYDQTPVRDAYRNVQLPDNDRYVVALGTHVKPFKAVSFDLSWMHLFSKKSHVIPPTQVVGDEDVNTNGSVWGSADVIGFQVNWDLA